MGKSESGKVIAFDQQVQIEAWSTVLRQSGRFKQRSDNNYDISGCVHMESRIVCEIRQATAIFTNEIAREITLHPFAFIVTISHFSYGTSVPNVNCEIN